MQAAVLANVALALQSLQVGSSEVAERLKNVSAVLRFHDVPTALQQRVTDSIEYYWSQRYGVQDRSLVNLFPPRCTTVPPVDNVELSVGVLGRQTRS